MHSSNWYQAVVNATLGDFNGDVVPISGSPAHCLIAANPARMVADLDEQDKTDEGSCMRPIFQQRRVCMAMR
jgi:hypothetical protein